MALRHTNVKFSAVPNTGAIKLRFLSLLFQNVTDFSGYRNDPVIGSWLGSNSITVDAYGDNLQVDVIEETASMLIVRCGSLMHRITISGTSLTWESSINDGTSYVSQLIPFNTVQFVYRMADSYIATAILFPAPTIAVSNSMLFFKHEDFGIRIQGPTTALAYKPDGTFIRANVLTPYGAVPSYTSLPSMVRSTEDGVSRKALFPIQAALDDSSLIEVSTNHSVLTMAYGTSATEYADQFTTLGTTYRVVGHFAFPS